MPGLWYKTRRADYARVRGIDLDGNEVVLEGSGLMGRMLQHECDHLDGHVYLDRTERKNAAKPCATCAIVRRSSPYSAPTLAGAVERSETEGGSAGTARDSPQSPTATGSSERGACFSTGSVLFSKLVCHPATDAVAGVQSHPILSTGTQQIRVMLATACVGRLHNS